MMEKKRGKHFGSLWVVLTVLLPFLSACGINKGIERNELENRVLSPLAPLVAVLPFENLSEYPNAGEILTRLMATELYRQRSFNIREEDDLYQQMAAGQVEKGGIPSTPSRVQQLAHKLGVDAVLLGSVTEFHYQHGLREEPVVGLSVRLVRSCDGQVVWAASRSVSGKGLLRRESLNQVAQRVVRELVNELGEVDHGELRCPGESQDDVGQAPTESGSAATGREARGEET